MNHTSHSNELTHISYTVGWVCALPKELIAASAMLDEPHPDLPRQPNDQNVYTLGRIGAHNVVMACLPKGGIGNNNSATVATRMTLTFPSIKFGLMVGIGGGVPKSVRLGDVVVSTPSERFGGVVQWDFGKTEQGGTFKRTGALNRPPAQLLAALTSLEKVHAMRGSTIPQHLEEMKQKYPLLAPKYARSEALKDVLFKANYTHVVKGQAEKDKGHETEAEEDEEEEDEEEQDCAYCDISHIVRRRPRAMRVHYGLIASGNQVIKDAAFRNEINKQLDGKVLCFEMEAAGLMNDFPCIVIRGICDYADSHKNKAWQEHAAAVAAAFAKELLSVVPAQEVEQMPVIKSTGLQKVAEEHRDIAQKQLDIQEHAAKQKLSKEQAKCLQLFRLTSRDKDATYEWYKDRIEKRVDGTCEWFLSHKNFQVWLKQDSGPLLVSADPGCGKSVLAKYLIDEALPRSATICYFFFKDQDQNTVRQALCALLHQLFIKKPSLVEHATEQFANEGPGLINSTRSLWTVLENAARDLEAGPIIIVLDALDECAEPEFVDLMRNIEDQFRRSRSNRGKVKYLLTSRPYEQIMSKFMRLLDDFPYIRIPGEEELESISLEVNHVIKHRVEQLTKEKGLSDQVKNHLASKLLKITHRTYLWLYLVFDYLNGESFKKTPRGVDHTMAVMPKTINEAYEQILNKSKDHPMVRKALSIILAASRPLTLLEMSVAVNIDNTSQSFHDLDLEKEEDFKSRLRSWCGLFVSIHHGKIYFLHQTAREFLLAELQSPIAIPSGLNWCHSITISGANTVLAEVCVRYLNFFNSDTNLVVGDAYREAVQEVEDSAFMDYSAKNWGFHFREAHISNNAAILPIALRVCDPGSSICSRWLRLYWLGQYRRFPENFTSIMISSYFGHQAVVELLLEKDAELESKDSEYGRTPLSWAAENGHDTVVKLLLEKGAELESKDSKYRRTPLSWAAENGHDAVVKLLLEKGAELESKGSKYGRTPLSWAAENGHDAVVKLLLENGAELESKDIYGYTPLSWAAMRGRDAVVKLLLENGAELESKDSKYDRTPLSWAVVRGQDAVVKLLLEKGVELESKDSYGQTPLSWAAVHGQDAVVILLLEKGAELESKDSYGRTPLSLAAANGQDAVVKLLLENGAELESKGSKYGRTPLSLAAEDGYDAVVKLLLENGAELESKDSKYRRTPLSLAAENGHDTVVKLLLEKGAELESKGSKYRRTPLSLAAKDGHDVVVKLLLEKGAELESKDSKYRRTPLSWAAENGHDAVVKLLLDNGAELESKDIYGHTPLLWATVYGRDAVVKLLLEKGVELESKGSEYGRTPLSLAAENGHDAVVKLLLENGAELESKDSKYRRTPLSWAAENGHDVAVKLLLENGAELESKDSRYGYTPLSWAAVRGRDTVVKLLLEKGAELESKDIYGRTSLSWAAVRGRDAVVKLLLEKGAELESKDNYGRTPLLWAAVRGRDAVVKLLLEKGAELESKGSKYGRTPLSLAAENGHDAVVRLLLEKGAELESKDSKYDRTPLSWAAENGHDAVVRLLLEKGAELESKDSKYDRTPLSWAAENGHDAVMKLLLGKDAKED